MLPIQTLTMGRNIVNVFKNSQSLASRALMRISIRPEYVKSQKLNHIRLGAKQNIFIIFQNETFDILKT